MKCEYHYKLHTINVNAQPFYSCLCGLGRVMIIFNFIMNDYLGMKLKLMTSLLSNHKTQELLTRQ